MGEAQGEVIHAVAGSRRPNREKSVQGRVFMISTDRLVLSMVEILYRGAGLKGVLVWERVAWIKALEKLQPARAIFLPEK